MEKKEFSSPARRYGKFFIAFIFITAGVLLLARNLGWISYTPKIRNYHPIHD